MSATAQQQQNAANNGNSGKKSSNSSAGNTPASTPVNGGQATSQHSSPPPNNNAPKYGTLVPNRIFVGGISSNTTEGELLQLFSNYGTVKAAKIIQDRAGVSKGYGFITFESEDDAKRPLREAENIVLRERKLNIAPAIKKQPFNRAFDASSPPAVAGGGNPAAQFFFQAGAAAGHVPLYHSGVAYYQQPPPGAQLAPQPQPGADPTQQQQQQVYQPPPVYPSQTGPPQAASYPSMMFPPAMYIPQQYPVPIPYDYNYFQNGSHHQYMHNPGGPGGGPPCQTSSSNSATLLSNVAGMQQQQQNSVQQQQQQQNVNSAQQQQQNAFSSAHQQQMLDAAMFYNMATLYGGQAATVEGGAPLYSAPMDAFDFGAAQCAPYCSEQDYYSADAYDCIPAENFDQPHFNQQQPAQQPLLPLQISDLIPVNQQPPFPITQSPITVLEICETNNNNNSQTQTDSERNTTTPVVSLLSIDSQQEKDFNSMQGGRKKMQIAPTAQAVNFKSNGVLFPYTTTSLTNGYHQYLSYGGHHHPHNHHQDVNSRFNRSLPNGLRQKSNNFNRRNNNNTTDSSNNSSSSENKTTSSEEKFTTNVTTQPPTAYSPIANYNIKPLKSREEKNNNTSTVQVAAQTFVPPRRNRRSIRRPTNSAAEIGQGDAPTPQVQKNNPPGPDDVCKKLDNLEL